jgi:hypothetical protein
MLNAIYHYDPATDNWTQLPIHLPSAMLRLSGYYDDTTHLLHVIHGLPAQHYYIEWPMQSRDWTDSHLNQWKQLFPTGSSPITPLRSMVIDI